ncbi:MAG: hypothetical protein WCK97_07950 [Actinomycetes bacterium]
MRLNSKRSFLVPAIAFVALLAAAPAGASAAITYPKVATPDYPAGTVTKTYKVPLTIKPGQNLNMLETLRQNSDMRPSEPGWILGFVPTLKLANGTTPPVDQIHLHHLVLYLGGTLVTAAGEEKTHWISPKGFGYRYNPSDLFILNHMIHNLTASPEKVIFEYTLYFLPDTAPAAADITRVRTAFVDVTPSTYPVFDVLRGSGVNGRYTYPQMSPASLMRRNVVPIQHDGSLVATAGHLHPGGLYTDLFLTRGDKTVKIFRSNAYYYGRALGNSWNVSMGATSPNWRVRVKAGDVLSIQVTYDSSKSSWYESMGISPVQITDVPAGGVDPFTTDGYAALDQTQVLTHGELKENRDYGGSKTSGYADARKLADGPTLAQVNVKNFLYQQGDLTMPGKKGRPPVIKQGHSLTFVNQDPTTEIYHTATPCKAPCDLSSGISYPLANGVTIDSGELGFPYTGAAVIQAAAGTASWSTPSTLKPGTYTYFCRVHPFMRGAFRVKAAKG